MFYKSGIFLRNCVLINFKFSTRIFENLGSKIAENVLFDKNRTKYNGTVKSFHSNFHFGQKWNSFRHLKEIKDFEARKSQKTSFSTKIIQNTTQLLSHLILEKLSFGQKWASFRHQYKIQN